MRIQIKENKMMADFGYIGEKISTGEILTKGDENLMVEITFPELTGTEKQVKFAEDIRTNKASAWMQELKNMGTDKFVDRMGSMQKAADYILKNNNQYSWLVSETSAAKVINEHK